MVAHSALFRLVPLFNFFGLFHDFVVFYRFKYFLFAILLNKMRKALWPVAHQVSISPTFYEQLFPPNVILYEFDVWLHTF
jgi:hypothetical protein